MNDPAELAATLATLADVSYLWMREFYLELCQRVQFPLSMSLPWILVDHVLQMRNRPLMPLLLAPLEAYNDAATAALRTHRQQYLYREIEAEVNLAFDQILFSLADQVYTHYKTRAIGPRPKPHSSHPIFPCAGVHPLQDARRAHARPLAARCLRT